MEVSADSAKFTKGGIDLNPNEIKMEVQKNGNGVIIPHFSQPVSGFQNITGFLPVIINITPINNLPLTLGLVADQGPTNELSSL